MISGAHIVIYSRDAEADRAFPAETGGSEQLFLMCDDLDATMAALAAHGIACGSAQQQPWGMLTTITLPGGGLGLYQPRHAQP